MPSMENTFVIYTNVTHSFGVLVFIHKKIILHAIYIPHFYILTHALD